MGLGNKLEVVRVLVNRIQNLEQEKGELLRLISAQPSKFKEWCVSLVPPGYWYELSFNEQLDAYVEIAGLHDHLTSSVRDGSLFSESEAIHEVEPDWEKQGPSAARFNLVFSALYALVMTQDAIKRVGRTLNELVAEGGNGNTDSLKLAIKLDPLVIGAPSVSSAVFLHEIAGKNTFKRDIQNALKNPRKVTPVDHGILRFALRAMYEDGVLQGMSEEHRYEYFCIDLGIYPDTGKDPAGSLNRWIRRWQENHLRTRTDQVLSSPYRDHVINFLSLIETEEAENELTEDQPPQESPRQ